MEDLIKQIEFIQKEIKKDSIQKVVVAGIVKINQQILLLQRIDSDYLGGLFEFPSGNVEDGESYLEALKREVFEETGLNIERIDGFVNSFDYYSSSGKKVRQLNFIIQTDTNTIKLNPSEHSRYIWVTPSDIKRKKLNISSETYSSIMSSLNLSENS